MTNKSGEIKTKHASIYAEMRAINSMDLSRNEAKVLLCYRLAMDEATRQVRGKDQGTLSALCGLSKTQFSLASASLARRGFIQAHRTRNSSQIVTVERLEVGDQETPELETRETPEPECSKLRKFEIRNPGSSKSGTPGFRCDDSLSAPVTALKSAQSVEPPPEPKPSVAATVPDIAALSDRLHRAAGPALASHAVAPGLYAMTVPMMWLDQGCDLDRDVLPAIAAVVAKGKRGVASWDYFTRAVAEAKARRMQGLPAVAVGKPMDREADANVRYLETVKRNRLAREATNA